MKHETQSVPEGSAPVDYGDLVWWIHRPRGGYCMPINVPAVVDRVTRAGVIIWAATMNRARWAKRVRVKRESLRPRGAGALWIGAFDVEKARGIKSRARSRK